MPLASALLLVAAVGCEDQRTDHPFAVAEGTYHLAYGVGLTDDEEASLAGLSAHLDRPSGRLTLALPGQAARVLVFSPWPRDQWVADCATMSGSSANEVADLSPVPLVLGPVRFETPLVHAKCGQNRMVLADTYDGAKALSFDLDDLG